MHSPAIGSGRSQNINLSELSVRQLANSVPVVGLTENLKGNHAVFQDQSSDFSSPSRSAKGGSCSKGLTRSAQDMTRYLKQNAVCVINCSWDKSELEKQLPAKMRKDLAEKQASHGDEGGETVLKWFTVGTPPFVDDVPEFPNKTWIFVGGLPIDIFDVTKGTCFMGWFEGWAIMRHGRHHIDCSARPNFSSLMPRRLQWRHATMRRCEILCPRLKHDSPGSFWGVKI